MENDLIKADSIESTEFPDLAAGYRVYAVPRTVINQTAFIEGAMPEAYFLDGILKTIGSAEGGEPQSSAG